MSLCQALMNRTASMCHLQIVSGDPGKRKAQLWCVNIQCSSLSLYSLKAPKTCLYVAASIFPWVREDNSTINIDHHFITNSHIDHDCSLLWPSNTFYSDSKINREGLLIISLNCIQTDRARFQRSPGLCQWRLHHVCCCPVWSWNNSEHIIW